VAHQALVLHKNINIHYNVSKATNESSRGGWPL
jgi:hypothetical protein